MSWKNIKTACYIPESKKEKEDIDWLEEVYKAKKECKIKTEAPVPFYLNPITTIRLGDLKKI